MLCRFFISVLLVSIGACGRARLVDDPLPDAGGDGATQDVLRFDAPRFDVNVRDTNVPVDVGVDAGPATGFEAALTCGLNNDGAIRAALRTHECEGLPFSLVYEGYEAFLFSRSDFGLSGLPVANCEYWQCVAEAQTCGDYTGCFVGHRCSTTEFNACEGDVITECNAGQLQRRVDCAAFGASCVAGRCVNPEGCEFSLTGNDISCRDGQLQLCGGDRSLDCSARSRFGCNRVAIGGEVPVSWCGRSAAGLYGTPNDCLSETRLSFVSASGTAVEFDCRDYGYGQCGETGCF